MSLTKEQKELFDSMTSLQQKAAMNVIKGMSNIDAYYAAGGKATTKLSAEASASELLSNLKVSSFIRSVRGDMLSEAIMTRQEMLERLSNLARVSMSDLIEWGRSEDADEDGNPTEQTFWAIKQSALLDENKMASIAEVTAGREGLKIKQHSPLQAMKAIADLSGYNAPTKTEVSGKDGGAIETVSLSKEDYQSARSEMLDSDEC